MTTETLVQDTPADIKRKILALAEKVYGKPAASLSDEQINDVIMLDMQTVLAEITVYVFEKRQTEVQYAMNDYAAEIKIDLRDASKHIKSILEKTPPEDVLERYINLKETFYHLIRAKWDGNEDYLKSLLRGAQTKDKIRGLGRYAIAM